MKRAQYMLALVAFTAAGCASGGLVGSLPVVPDPAQAATVVVIRQYGFVGSAGAITVTIDGLETYGLGVNEHVALAVAPGDRLVGLFIHTFLGPDVRATVKIRAEAGRTYFVLMDIYPAPLMTEITEAEGRALMAKTTAVQGSER